MQYGKNFYFGGGLMKDEQLLWGMKQGILLLFRTQKQPKERVILLSLFVFFLHAAWQLCQIIYGKK